MPTHSNPTGPRPKGPKPLFFYRESDSHGYLCQWYPCEFRAECETFTCAEQYLMWAKAKTFGDSAAMAAILRAKEPRKQKALGRKVKGFNEEVWDRVKEQIVEEATYQKFSWNKDLETRLLETGERELVEASPFDRVWGIGVAVGEAAKTPREEWGQNLLGKALGRVRARLRAEAEEVERQRRGWMEDWGGDEGKDAGLAKSGGSTKSAGSGGK